MLKVSLWDPSGVRRDLRAEHWDRSCGREPAAAQGRLAREAGTRAELQSRIPPSQYSEIHTSVRLFVRKNKVTVLLFVFPFIL